MNLTTEKIIIIVACLILAIASFVLFFRFRSLLKNNQNEPVEALEARIKSYVNAILVILGLIIGLSIYIFFFLK